MQRAWWQYEDDYAPYGRVNHQTCEVYGGPLMQPIGFVWWSKPRYRVKAETREIEDAPVTR